MQEIQRTEKSIVYQLPDGTRQLVSYTYPRNTLVNGVWETTKEGFSESLSSFKNQCQRFNSVLLKGKHQEIVEQNGNMLTAELLGAAMVVPELINDNSVDIEGNPMKNKLLFRDVFPNVDVQYTGMWYGNKRDIIVKAPTITTFSLSFSPQGCSLNTINPSFISKKGQRPVPLSFADANNNVFNVFPMRAWDANNKDVPLTVTQTQNGNVVTANISYDPTGFTYPITIDPTITQTSLSGDGFIRRANSVSWADVRGGVDGDSASTTETAISGPQDDKEGANWFDYRVFLPFDTSAIGASDTVNSASLAVVFASLTGTQHGVIVKRNQASTTALSTTNGDYSSGDFTARSSIHNLANGADTFTITGNLSDDSIITRAGNTKLGLIGGCDQQNIDPATGGTNCATGSHFIATDSSENATPANRPVLTVDYTVAVTAYPPTLLTLGAG